MNGTIVYFKILRDQALDKYLFQLNKGKEMVVKRNLCSRVFSENKYIKNTQGPISSMKFLGQILKVF